MQDVVNIARVVEALPGEFDVIRAEATAEGVRNMELLAAQWSSREQRFDEPGALFAAYVGGALAGVGGVTVETGLAEPAMRMRRLYVRPGFRGAGVGRRLAAAMMQQGLQEAPMLTTNARATEAAGPFWEAMGFTAVEWPGVTHVFRL